MFIRNPEKITWIQRKLNDNKTNFDKSQKLQILKKIIEAVTFEKFFEDATLHPNAHLIKGVICGVRIEDIEEPLMREIRYLDKLIDELARGRPMEKILRQS